MLLIISAIIIIVTPIIFCKALDELSIGQQMSRPLEPQYWGTGDRYLVGDFITEEQLEEMRRKVNSKNSKF